MDLAFALPNMIGRFDDLVVQVLMVPLRVIPSEIDPVTRRLFTTQSRFSHLSDSIATDPAKLRAPLTNNPTTT